MYNILERPDGGFQKHWCPICKTEYDCIASFNDDGCDDKDYERICLSCLGVQLGVDFISHLKIKDVKNRSPITSEEEEKK